MYNYKKLEDVADVTKLAGFEFSKYIEYKEEGEIIALRALNIKNNRLDLSDIKFIDNSVSDKLIRSKIYKNDILLTYTGNGWGDSLIIRENDKFHLAPNLAKITPTKVNPDFLFNFIQSYDFLKQMENYMVGSSQPTIPMKFIRKIKVPYPTHKDQKIIAKILTTILNKIELNIKINNNLEQFMKSLFTHWINEFNICDYPIKYKSSEFGNIPEKWNVKKLEDILISLESGKRPTGGITEIDGGIPSIGAENILGLGKFDYSKNKLITEEFFKSMKKGIVKNKDVLLYKDGAQLGRKSLFMDNFPFEKCCINEHVFILRPNDEVSPYYLYLWLDQKTMTNEIIALNSNSAQPGINRKGVNSLSILVPDKESMNKFNKTFEPLMKEIFANAIENQKLTKLRDILLPKLMSGEIDVSEINFDLE